MRRLSTLVAVAASAALVACPTRDARAQAKVEGFALNQFEPAPAGDAFFGVPSAGVGGHLVPRAMVMFDYAHRPLRFNTDTGETPIVASQGFLRIDASLALWDRVQISVDMPFAIVQSGQDPQIPGVDFHPPSSAAVGDLRFGLRGRIAGGDRDPIQIGIGSYLFLPTGSTEGYAGEGAARGVFQALLGGRVGSDVGFVWSAAGGVELRGGSRPHQLVFGGGAGLMIGGDLLQIGPELYGSTDLGGEPLTAGTSGITATSQTHLELLGGVKLRVLGGLVFGAAAGPGLSSAAGTPEFRAIGTIGWAPAAPVEKPKVVTVVGDRDDDGIKDDIDACPDEKGELQSDPAKDGCPPADRDKDGVLDVDDACPTLEGQRNVDATKNGCPKDTDEDGIYDPVDICPEEKGVASQDPKKNGCPGDRDSDGVIDAADACPDQPGPKSADAKYNGCPDDPDGDGIKAGKDACPNEKGPANPDPAQNGCPVLARVINDEIVIKQQVQFQVYGNSRSETVDPVSNDLMNEIRDVLNQHPEITKLEVQGHTDDSGNEAFNQHLSEERATAVRQWLIDAGIPANKLVAKGYGYSKPLADNRIRQGRQQNRRVQFVIIERK
jgi:OmpA-OmpF porin, OOP family